MGNAVRSLSIPLSSIFLITYIYLFALRERSHKRIDATNRDEQEKTPLVDLASERKR